MKIAFDLDGTITEGRFLTVPRSREDYMSLTLRDEHTRYIYNDIASEHEVYIITARGWNEYQEGYWPDTKEYTGHIEDWFRYYSLKIPEAIIPAIRQEDKWQLAKLIGCKLLFDDSPKVFNCRQLNYSDSDWEPPVIWLIDNPHWKENQETYTSMRLHNWQDIEKVISNYNETINNRESY